MSQLLLQNLHLRYGAAPAVADLNLEVRDGELVSLLGPSGCGKTTTMRAVAGLLAPSSGRIMLGGQDITQLPANKRNIGSRWPGPLSSSPACCCSTNPSATLMPNCASTCAENCGGSNVNWA